MDFKVCSVSVLSPLLWWLWVRQLGFDCKAVHTIHIRITNAAIRPLGKSAAQVCYSLSHRQRSPQSLTQDPIEHHNKGQSSDLGECDKIDPSNPLCGPRPTHVKRHDISFVELALYK